MNYTVDEMYKAKKEDKIILGKGSANGGSTKNQNMDSNLEPSDQHQSQRKMLLRERNGREEAIQQQAK